MLSRRSGIANMRNISTAKPTHPPKLHLPVPPDEDELDEEEELLSPLPDGPPPPQFPTASP
jgi:hypothetical protein